MTPAMREAYPWLVPKLMGWEKRTGANYSDLVSLANESIAQSCIEFDNRSDVTFDAFVKTKLDLDIKKLFEAERRVDRIAVRYRLSRLGAQRESKEPLSCDIFALELAIKKVMRHKPIHQERAWLWIQGYNTKEICEKLNLTSLPIWKSLTKVFPFYDLVRQGECRRGHVLTRHNHRLDARGHVVCLPCKKDWDRNRYEPVKAHARSRHQRLLKKRQVA